MYGLLRNPYFVACVCMFVYLCLYRLNDNKGAKKQASCPCQLSVSAGPVTQFNVRHYDE